MWSPLSDPLFDSGKRQFCQKANVSLVPWLWWAWWCLPSSEFSFAMCNGFQWIVSRMWPYCVLLACLPGFTALHRYLSLHENMQLFLPILSGANSSVSLFAWLRDLLSPKWVAWPLVGQSITFTVIGQNGDLLAPKRHLKPCPLALVRAG